jgi:hypothetical protein
LVRSGDVIKLYLDGVQEGPSLAFTGPVFDSTNIFVIGALGTYSLYWTGYMDEWRITKGKALWTANFTPPTMAAT